MTKAVLLHKSGSIYDDVPWERYHFPNRSYLKAMRETVGDWIVYYEPMGSGSSRGGRQAYFAVAQVDRIETDPRDDSHSYAFMRPLSYQELSVPVPMIGDQGHFEGALEKPDGTTNGGLRQRAVRRITDAEFTAILRAGLAVPLRAMQQEEAHRFAGMAEEQAPFERPIIEQLLRRPLRDAAFREGVLRAYDSTCAFTGLRIINGGGRAEVDAAHIRPVGDNHGGSDSIRNGLALSKTMHWLFDRGIVAVSNNYEILQSPGRLPDQLRGLLNRDGMIRIPKVRSEQPHPDFLAYHRAMFEEEYGAFRPLT